MNFIIHLHSGLRYIILLGLVSSIILALKGKLASSLFTQLQTSIAKITVILVHSQLLLGLYLYFTSGKVMFSNMKEVMGNALLRFFTVEHLLGMIIAIVLITIGNAKVKRAKTDTQKHKHILLFFSLGLILIFASIPWEFMARF